MGGDPVSDRQTVRLILGSYSLAFAALTVAAYCLSGVDYGR